ncbi:MAG: DUF2339 domain-containing protein [Campylobacteraceae bacterium]|jgi:uncharacterized membrane protein|nr:DUF2339 domain-containing protein [Campylobacteraceae bacterium]
MDELLYFLIGLSVILIVVLLVLPIIALVTVNSLKQRVKYLEEKLRNILRTENLGETLKPKPIKAPETEEVKIYEEPPKPVVHEKPPISNVYEAPRALNAVQNSGARPKLQKIHRQLQESKNDTQSPIDEARKRFIAWLGENFIAKIAVVILFFGVSFLLKYSIDHGLLSPEVRVLGSLILGFVLFGIGWRFRKTKELYSLILQGGGIGVLYITIFAAFKLYVLIPAAAAFALLIIICAISVYFAILQNAISLAVLAFVGAYLSPILISSGRGEHIILFSYYTIVSLALVIISRWRSWRILNLIGFAFTAIVTGLWYIKSYKIEFYPETQAFIIANLLIFGILAVLLFVRRERESIYHNVIDITLLFGVPILSYALEYRILSHLEFAPAFAALAFALFYIAGAFGVFKKFKHEGKRASFYMLGIGIGFATLAVPLAFDNNLTSLIWLFEGSAITWAALKNNQYKLGFFGLLITVFGAVLLMHQHNAYYYMFDYDDVNDFIIPYGFMSVILFFNACLFYRYKKLYAGFNVTGTVLLVVSALSWVYWIVKSSDVLYLDDLRFACIIAAFVAASWFWYFVGKAMKWEALEYALISLWPALFCVNIVSIGYSSFFLDISFALAIVSGYLYLYKGSVFKQLHKNMEPILHVSLFWLVLIWIYSRLDAISYEFIPWHYQTYLNWVLFSTVFGFVILAVYIFQKKALFPFGKFLHEYWHIGLAPVVLFLVFKLLSSLFIGHEFYLQYIPVLNPLEESVIFILTVVGFYLSETLKNKEGKILFFAYLFFALICFLEFNSLVLRTVSYFFDIPWSFYYLWNSEIVQSVLSIIWTLLALSLIIFANRSKRRKIWFIGMALLVIVVIKLVLHDSVKLEGLFRASVFIGVALLMLVIGFLAPIPPKENIDIKKD